MGEEQAGNRQKFLPIIRDDAGQFLRRRASLSLPKIDATVAGSVSLNSLPPDWAHLQQEQAIAKTLLRRFRGLDADPRQSDDPTGAPFPGVIV